MPQELDEVEGPDDLVEGELDELVDDDLIAEDGLALPDEDDDADVVEVEEEEDEVVDIPDVGARSSPRPATADEEEEEEPDDEDVEASLDVILKERLVVEEVEDDEDTPEPEDKTGGRRAGAAQAARRVRVPLVLPGQAPEPAGRQEEDALPGLCLRSRRWPSRRRRSRKPSPLRRTLDVLVFVPDRCGRVGSRGAARAGCSGQGPPPAWSR